MLASQFKLHPGPKPLRGGLGFLIGSHSCLSYLYSTSNWSGEGTDLFRGYWLVQPNVVYVLRRRVNRTSDEADGVRKHRCLFHIFNDKDGKKSRIFGSRTQMRTVKYFRVVAVLVVANV